jgi:hypothetical protein
MNENKQKESGKARRGLAIALAATCLWMTCSAHAEDKLDAGGATYRDYARPDNGASFFKVEGMASGGNASDLTPARLVGADNAQGTARVRFDAIRTEVTLPMGWQASEDWERGVAFSGDRRYRLVAWRVDFAFEGVKNAEHYVATKSGSIQARRPNVQAQARKLADGTFMVIYQNVAPSRGDSEQRVVFDVLLTPSAGAREGALLTLGVPASEAERGLRLIALIKASAKVEW